MSEPPVLPPLYCSRCGTLNPPHATTCWLCDDNQGTASSDSSKLVTAAELANDPVLKSNQSRTQILCSALLIVCIVLTILIGVGLAVQEPGSLIAYAIFVGPAYLATGIRALHGMATDSKPKASSLLLTFVLSGVFTFMAVVILAIASVVAFFVWCLTQL